MVDMDVSDDMEEILFLLEDNVFDRWRMNFHFLNLNHNIYGRFYERVTNRLGDVRNMNLPAIKGPPNTDKLLVSQWTCAPASPDPNSCFRTFRKRDSTRGSETPPPPRCNPTA